MPAAEHPFNQIGGIDTVSAVVKSDFVSWAKARSPLVVATPTELRSFDLTGQNMVWVKSIAKMYASDTTDTTTADDGVLCIHDFNGLRFKVVVVQGDVLAANNLSDLADKHAAFDRLTIHGADVASAATLNLDTATGDVVDVTGTTTITAITLSEGRRRIVRFTGSLTLTHGASLILPDGTIKTQAGAFAMFIGYGSGVVLCAWYTPAPRASFLAHKNGTDQTGIADSTFTAVTYGTELFDRGSYFASNAWTPPKGLVFMHANAFFAGTFVSGNQVAVSIYKNSSGFRQGNAPASSVFAGAGVSVSAIDEATGTDVYEVRVFADVSSGTATLSGNTSLNYFTGHWIGP